jgi:hypothetical protein
MVVVGPFAASGIPVLSNEEDGIRIAVGQRIIKVGAVPGDVLVRGALDKYRFLW